MKLLAALGAAIAGLFVTVWGLIHGLVRAKSAQAVAEKRADDLEANLEANDAAKIHLDDPPRGLGGRRALAARMRRERAAARLPDS